MTPQDELLKEAILILNGLMDALDSAHPYDIEAISRIQKSGVATRARKLIKEF